MGEVPALRAIEVAADAIRGAVEVPALATISIGDVPQPALACIGAVMVDALAIIGTGEVPQPAEEN